MLTLTNTLNPVLTWHFTGSYSIRSLLNNFWIHFTGVHAIQKCLVYAVAKFEELHVSVKPGETNQLTKLQACIKNIKAWKTCNSLLVIVLGAGIQSIFSCLLALLWITLHGLPPCHIPWDSLWQQHIRIRYVRLCIHTILVSRSVYCWLGKQQFSLLKVE